MHRPPPGRTVTVSTQGEPFQAFVPVALPPQPPLVWSAALRRRFDDALVALGRLDAVSAMLPNASLLLYSFVRKEAVLSSQIEGTQSSLADLLLFEIDELPGVPLDDAHEVSRCVAAMVHGTERLRSGFPLSLRLLREMHALLLDHPQGRGKTPGEFRRSQVWLGGTRPGNAVFVPPPADQLPGCLDAFERFLHDDPEPTSPLLRAALAHVQFETIHPFLDGNGRIGRSLIVLQLVADTCCVSRCSTPACFSRRTGRCTTSCSTPCACRATGSAGWIFLPRRWPPAQPRRCIPRWPCWPWWRPTGRGWPHWAGPRHRPGRCTARYSASR